MKNTSLLLKILFIVTAFISSPVISEELDALTPQDEKLLYDYKLDASKVKSYIALHKKLAVERKTNPTLNTEMKKYTESSEKSETIQDLETALEGLPTLYGEAKSAGFSSEEFIILPLALMQAAAATMMEAMPSIPKDSIKISPENRAFINENKALLSGVETLGME